MKITHILTILLLLNLQLNMKYRFQSFLEIWIVENIRTTIKRILSLLLLLYFTVLLFKLFCHLHLWLMAATV